MTQHQVGVRNDCRVQPYSNHFRPAINPPGAAVRFIFLNFELANFNSTVQKDDFFDGDVTFTLRSPAYDRYNIPHRYFLS